MNQQNVAALGLAFSKMLDAWFKLPENEVAQYDGPDMRFVGEFLAKEGVLVPSALTGDQVWAVVQTKDGYPVEGFTHTSEEAQKHVAGILEKIAKGET